MILKRVYMDEDIVTGYSVLAYSACEREAWFVLRRFKPEQDNPYIELGRYLHKNSYEGKGEKEISLPGAVIDVMWKDKKCTIVGEIKKSSKSLKGARIQLLFYLKLLRDKNVEAQGFILLPKEKKKIPIEYDEQAEMEIKEILLKLEELKQLSIPPPPKWKGICSKCGFSELCWAGDD
jgi:CRISPR-associated exonuclease Cas4